MNQAGQCSANVEVFWTFVRGDMETADFERWVYANSSLEDELGAEFYLDIISMDYSDTREIDHLQVRLRAFAVENTDSHCQCLTLSGFYRFEDWGDGQISMFEVRAERGKPIWFNRITWLDEGLSTLHTFKVRDEPEEPFRKGNLAVHRFEVRDEPAEPFWWISAQQCTACGQGWLVAGDPVEYEFIMKRLSPEEMEGIIKDNRWPSDFDDFEIIRTGRRAPNPGTAAYPDLQSFEDLATLSAEEMRAVMDALFVAGEDGVPSIAATPEGDRAHAIAAAFSGASEQVRDAMTDVLTEAEARCLREDITAGRPPTDMVLAAQAAILEVARQPDRHIPPKRFEPSESQIREAEEHKEAILKGLGDILKD